MLVVLMKISMTFNILWVALKIFLIQYSNKLNKHETIIQDMFIKKGKFLKVLWHCVHVLPYYPKFNNKHHTKPSYLHVCWIKVSNVDDFVTPFLYHNIKATYKAIELCQGVDNGVTEFLSKFWIMILRAA